MMMMQQGRKIEKNEVEEKRNREKEKRREREREREREGGEREGGR